MSFIVIFKIMMYFLLGFFIFKIGEFLYGYSKEKNKKPMLYWGTGFIFWAIIYFISAIFLIFKFLEDINFIDIDRIFIDESWRHIYSNYFVFYLGPTSKIIFSFILITFLLYGTLLLFMKSKDAKKIRNSYLIILLIYVLISIIFDSELKFFNTWFEILFITPIFLAISYYFYLNYKKLREPVLLRISVFWILLTIVQYATIGVKSFQIKNEILYNAIDLAVIIILFAISSALTKLTISHQREWEEISDYSIKLPNEKFMAEIKLYMGSNVEEKVRDLLHKMNIENINITSPENKKVFVENLIDTYFIDSISNARKRILISELSSLIGIEIEAYDQISEQFFKN